MPKSGSPKEDGKLPERTRGESSQLFAPRQQILFPEQRAYLEYLKMCKRALPLYEPMTFEKWQESSIRLFGRTSESNRISRSDG